MKHIPACLLPLTIVIAACTSCAVTDSGSRTDNPVVGRWEGKSGALDVTIVLREDKTCEGLEQGITRLGRWQQKGPSVIIALDGDVLYGGLISRREMLITRENTGKTITLMKTNAAN